MRLGWLVKRIIDQAAD